MKRLAILGICLVMCWFNYKIGYIRGRTAGYKEGFWGGIEHQANTGQTYFNVIHDGFHCAEGCGE